MRNDLNATTCTFDRETRVRFFDLRFSPFVLRATYRAHSAHLRSKGDRVRGSLGPVWTLFCIMPSSSNKPFVQPGEPLNDFLRSFWRRQIDTAEQETPDYRHPPLPLARIKKVMKSDPEVKVRCWRAWFGM